MYKKSHSKEKLEQVCELAGTKLSWFSLCTRGHGKFSIEIAVGLEAASRELAEGPDDYMTVADIFDLNDRVSDARAEIRRKLLDRYAA